MAQAKVLLCLSSMFFSPSSSVLFFYSVHFDLNICREQVAQQKCDKTRRKEGNTKEEIKKIKRIC